MGAERRAISLLDDLLRHSPTSVSAAAMPRNGASEKMAGMGPMGLSSEGRLQLWAPCSLLCPGGANPTRHWSDATWKGTFAGSQAKVHSFALLFSEQWRQVLDTLSR